MDTSTRLPGHGLLAEGKPFEDDGRGGVRRADIYGEPDGFGVCSCGARSGVLGLDADRKRWHRAHKDEIRKRWHKVHKGDIRAEAGSGP